MAAMRESNDDVWIFRSIHLEASPFGAYYHRLVARGMKKGMAVVAVMRKLLIVAVHRASCLETIPKRGLTAVLLDA
jgi:hypothetical protein